MGKPLVALLLSIVVALWRARPFAPSPEPAAPPPTEARGRAASPRVLLLVGRPPPPSRPPRRAARARPDLAPLAGPGLAAARPLAPDPQGRTRERGDGTAFFRALRGKTDPRAELEATSAPSSTTGPSRRALGRDVPVPARFAFLAGRLGADLARLPPRGCPRFEKFLERIRPRSATLVFSSYYLNNPASAFGHTFLRLNKDDAARAGREWELLDYGIDYAATVDTGNAVLYAAKGLIGLFKGEFGTSPTTTRSASTPTPSRATCGSTTSPSRRARWRSSPRTCGSSAAPTSTTRTSTRTAATTSSARSRRRRRGCRCSSTSAARSSIPSDTVKALFGTRGSSVA